MGSALTTVKERFTTYEEAARYAAERQSEGLFAKIQQEMSEDEAGPDIYWVGVSEPGGQLDDGRDLSRPEQIVAAAIRFCFMAVLGLGAGWAVLELAAYLFEGGLIPLLLFVAAVGCAFFALAGWSTLLAAVVGRSREARRSPVYPFALAFIAAILIGLTVWWW